MYFIYISINVVILDYIIKDYSEGFGGKYGVQTDRVDESAVGWDHHEKLAQHDSQKGSLE